MALVYDAVRLFAQTLHDIDAANTYQQFQTENISCEREEPWKFGSIISNHMRNVRLI